MYSSSQAGNNTYCLLSSPLMYFISDKCLIATKLGKYFEKTKDKVLTIRNIRRHFGCYGFSDNLPYWKCNWGNYITLFRGVWFIIVLFFMRILLGDIPLFSFIRKSYKIILPVLLFYMLIEPFFIHRMPQVQDYYLYKVIACMPFMMFGLLLKEYKTWMLSFGKYTLGVLLLVYIILVLYNGKNDIWAYTFTHGYFLFAVNAMLASLIFFNILKKTHQSQIIISFSKGTLLTMGMHTLLINILSRLFSKFHILMPETILSFVNGILVMVVCYFLIRLALRYCPVILGK